VDGTVCDPPDAETICGESGAAWRPAAAGVNDVLFRSPTLTLALPGAGAPNAGAPGEPFVDPGTPASGVALGDRASEVLKPPAFSAVCGEAANDGAVDEGEVDIAPVDMPDPTR
jgi:hypothetical protein